MNDDSLNNVRSIFQQKKKEEVTSDKSDNNLPYNFQELQERNEAIRKRGEKMRAAINASVIRSYNIRRRGTSGGSSGGTPPAPVG